MLDSHKAQHTPGPWEVATSRVHDHKDGSSWVVSVFADNAPSGDKMPAMCYANTREQAHANARLIAAAPDLLAALEMILVQFGEYNDGQGAAKYHAVNIARAAIARATGNTPQRTAAAVAVALGRSPTEPGTARLAADLEAAEDRKPSPGMVIVADWAGGDAQRMRLVSRYEHPAGNGWRVNIYDHRAKRFSKIEQSVSDQTVEAALLAGRVE